MFPAFAFGGVLRKRKVEVLRFVPPRRPGIQPLDLLGPSDEGGNRFRFDDGAYFCRAFGRHRVAAHPEGVAVAPGVLRVERCAEATGAAVPSRQPDGKAQARVRDRGLEHRGLERVAAPFRKPVLSRLHG